MQGAYHAIFGTDGMMAIPLHVQVCMCRLPKDSCGNASIYTWCSQYVQKWYGSIWSWLFCCKLYILVNGIYMVQETLSLSCFDDDTCVINISFLHKGGCGAVFKALISKSPMYKLATMGLKVQTQLFSIIAIL